MGERSREDERGGNEPPAKKSRVTTWYVSSITKAFPPTFTPTNFVALPFPAAADNTSTPRLTWIVLVTALLLYTFTLLITPSSVFHTSVPDNSISTIALPKGKAVSTSPRVMGPMSMAARTPPLLIRAKSAVVDCGGVSLLDSYYWQCLHLAILQKHKHLTCYAIQSSRSGR